MNVYSQGNEQIVLEQIFGRTIGTLLDIGAADGKTFSNSLALIEAGWTAMCIEPSPGQFIALKALHGTNPLVRLVHAAVGLDGHMVPFFDSPDLVSTTEAAHRDKWSAQTTFREHYVAQVTPAELLLQFGGGFDLISIDTEGTSTDLYFAMVAAGFNPTAWIVEHDGRQIEIANHAGQHGWNVRYLDGNNLILAK
jgi:FkbM family methyltransferase